MPKAASATPRCRRSTLPPEWRHVSGLHGGPSESTPIPQKKQGHWKQSSIPNCRLVLVLSRVKNDVMRTLPQ